MKFLPLFLCFSLGLPLGAETPPQAGKKPDAAAGPLFAWNLLWAGSWEEGKTLNNRGDLRLVFPRPALILRAGVMDRRPLTPGSSPPWKDVDKGITNYAAGLYHRPTGSRLLYGILDEWGLPARIRNPWARGLPLAENHQPSMADLKTKVSANGKPETYLYAGSPPVELFKQNPGLLFRGYASAQIDPDVSPGFGGGLEARFGKKAEVRLDGFYTGKTLPPRKNSAWFSEAPPLPEREFRIAALGLLLHTPVLTLSSDWACSETFAWGRDLYGNLGVRFARPLNRGRWALSLAADGAGSRFTGRDGSSPGAGFRTGGKLEWDGKRSGLFRLSTSLRSPGLEKPLNRSSSSLSWRLPAPGKERAGPFRLSRVSLGADRNASDQDKIVDGMSLTTGFTLNPRNFSGSEPAGIFSGLLGSPLGLSLSGSLKGFTAGNEGCSPYPAPGGLYRFDSAKAAGELSWSPGIFQFRSKAGYEIKNEKEGVWETSFSAAARFKPGRFSVKISSPDFPGQWTYTLSWRVEKK